MEDCGCYTDNNDISGDDLILKMSEKKNNYNQKKKILFERIYGKAKNIKKEISPDSLSIDISEPINEEIVNENDIMKQKKIFSLLKKLDELL